MKFPCLHFATLLACAFALQSHAALVSFDLNRASDLPDGPAYLRVTIDDQGLPGRINFSVSVLDPLLDLADHRFGIDSFAFNSDFRIGSSNITGLPSQWHFDGDEKMDEFGRFEASVEAKNASARRSELSFSITGIRMDTIWSYIEASSQHGGSHHGKDKGKKGYFFSAHVGGLDPDSLWCIDDSYFAGKSPSAPPVPTPIPGAAGLLLGGIGAMAFFRRRRQATGQAPRTSS